MEKLLREPLVHFIAIALTFFAAYDWLSEEPAQVEPLLVSEGRAEQLKNAFISRWQRQPVANELQVAIDGYALNQMYLREARALGLDQNDPVIDRRLRQKMDYLLEDLVSNLSPSEPQLQQFYRDHTDSYRVSARFVFEQVYLSADRSEAQLQQLQAEQQQRIDRGLAPQGDASMLPGQLSGTVEVLERRLGKAFVQQLRGQPVERWLGPLRSALGLHYVRIVQRTDAQVQPYQQVQDRVRADWQYREMKSYKSEFEQQLRSRYQLVSPSVVELAGTVR